VKAIQISEFGGPEVLELVELPDPEPANGEVLVEVARCGVNFADTHTRENTYLAKAELPLVPGGEISGTTTDGRRVAALTMNGGYAERIALPEAALVPVPDGVSDEVAAGLLLQGLTAHSLIHRCARLEAGESVAIHGAAGGTGTLAIQLAKRAGARVIALASSEEKRELTLRLGADAAIDPAAEDLTAALLEANDGEPLDAVFEMSGGEAFEASLRALRPFGRIVTFGIASRQPNEVATGLLMRNSWTVIGFWLVHLFRHPDWVREGIAELFEAVAAGQLEVVIGGVYPLAEASRAHQDIQARRTHGKLLLDPSA